METYAGPKNRGGAVFVFHSQENLDGEEGNILRERLRFADIATCSFLVLPSEESEDEAFFSALSQASFIRRADGMFLRAPVVAVGKSVMSWFEERLGKIFEGNAERGLPEVFRVRREKIGFDIGVLVVCDITPDVESEVSAGNTLGTMLRVAAPASWMSSWGTSGKRGARNGRRKRTS